MFKGQLEYDFEDLDTKVHQSGDEIYVTVSKMYNHLPLTFDTLMKLSELFGTRDFAVNQWSHLGCDTCDFGSEYAHEFTVKTSAVKAAQAAQQK